MVILQISAAMFLVMAVGWVARRRGYFSPETTRSLSRFVVDVAFPALVFVQLFKTVDASALRERWYIPLLGAALILSGHLVGTVTAPLFAAREKRRTFTFLVGMSNWVYLPLPITEALYGWEGIQTVLLVNIGGQVVLWTVIVGSLRGGRPNGETLRNLLLNPGLWATALGIGLALCAPGLKGCLEMRVAEAPAGVLAVKAILQPLELVGSITIPLSLVVIGAQLEDAQLEDAARAGNATAGLLPRFDRGVIGVLLARLFVAPLVFVALVLALSHSGARMLANPVEACCIMAAMPSAVSCGMFVERFGGDTSLAARAVLYTTFVALLSVPALFALFLGLGL